MFAAIRPDRVSSAGVTLLSAAGTVSARHRAVLYSRIVLPREWPPRLPDFPTSVEKDLIDPPYLASPAMIAIDVGRRAFSMIF
jgi:hypothetical protein